PQEQIDLVESYAKVQGLWHDPNAEPRFSETLELDLSTVVPSIAGPKRPQDRISLADARTAFRGALDEFVGKPKAKPVGYDKAVAERFPASDPPAHDEESDDRTEEPTDRVDQAPAGDTRQRDAVSITLSDGTQCMIDHGSVVIAAITSCTNTSNPTVMMAAA